MVVYLVYEDEGSSRPGAPENAFHSKNLIRVANMDVAREVIQKVTESRTYIKNPRITNIFSDDENDYLNLLVDYPAGGYSENT